MGRINDKKESVGTIGKRKAKCISHILRKGCLQKLIIGGKIAEEGEKDIRYADRRGNYGDFKDAFITRTKRMEITVQLNTSSDRIITDERQKFGSDLTSHIFF